MDYFRLYEKDFYNIHEILKLPKKICLGLLHYIYTLNQPANYYDLFKEAIKHSDIEIARFGEEVINNLNGTTKQRNELDKLSINNYYILFEIMVPFLKEIPILYPDCINLEYAHTPHYYTLYYTEFIKNMDKENKKKFANNLLEFANIYKNKNDDLVNKVLTAYINKNPVEKIEPSIKNLSYFFEPFEKDNDLLVQWVQYISDNTGELLHNRYLDVYSYSSQQFIFNDKDFINYYIAKEDKTLLIQQTYCEFIKIYMDKVNYLYKKGLINNADEFILKTKRNFDYLHYEVDNDAITAMYLIISEKLLEKLQYSDYYKPVMNALDIGWKWLNNRDSQSGEELNNAINGVNDVLCWQNDDDILSIAPTVFDHDEDSKIWGLTIIAIYYLLMQMSEYEQIPLDDCVGNNSSAISYHGFFKSVVDIPDYNSIWRDIIEDYLVNNYPKNNEYQSINKKEFIN